MVDFIGRELVAQALAEWRSQLHGTGTVSPLRNLAASTLPTIQIRGAHPAGLASLFAGRPTMLSTLYRERNQFHQALHRAQLILEAAEAHVAATGQWSVALAAGTVSWGGQELPILLRPVEMSTVRDDDMLLTLKFEVSFNPVLAEELRARGDDGELASNAWLSLSGKEFDPRGVWEELRKKAELFDADNFTVTEHILLSAYADLEQKLLADIDELDPIIRSSPFVAAIAGDQLARESLQVDLPPLAITERDPFGERGIGDLTDAEFAIVDLAASGYSILIDTPSGANVAAITAAIAADGAASGKFVTVVGGNEDAAYLVAQELDRTGAGDLFITGTAPAWNATARERLLAALTLDGPEVDEEYLRALGEGLISSRHELQMRLAQLHRSHRPWGVSLFAAVQALVRLTSADLLPRTQVRLDETAGAIVADVGLGAVVAAVKARVAELIAGEADSGDGDTSDPDLAPDPNSAAVDDATTAAEVATTAIPEVPLVPWWTGLVEPVAAPPLDEALAELTVHHLPRMQEDANFAATETGLDFANSLGMWAEQVELFREIQVTLDRFQPAVFHRAGSLRSMQDMISATAPPDSPWWQEMPRKRRRELIRRATELLRPGRDVTQLHAWLLAARAQSERWLALTGLGSWPLIPENFDEYGRRIDRVQELWDLLSPHLIQASGRTDLAVIPWGALQAELHNLAAGVPGGIAAVAHTPVQDAVLGTHFDELIDDLVTAQADDEQVRIDTEYAFWAAAFDDISARLPDLVKYGETERIVDRFIGFDAAFGSARSGPLMRAVAQRRRQAIAAFPDDARDLFAQLVEGIGGSYRELQEQYPQLVRALRPVVTLTPGQTAQMLPSERSVDLLIITGAESLSVAELIAAIARANQIVVLGDSSTATNSALLQFAAILPAVKLAATPQTRDVRIGRFLAQQIYGDALPVLPGPSCGEATFNYVDAIGTPAVGATQVDSTRAEVNAVVQHVVRVLSATPRWSVAVIAGNELHAARIKEALHARGDKFSAAVPVAVAGNAGGLRAEEVIISTGFARDQRGGVPQNLGRLAGADALTVWGQALAVGEWRTTIFAALTERELALTPYAPGDLAAWIDLYDYLDSPALDPERPQPGPADWLLADIARQLRADGYAVRLRYGVGADTIPMVVGGRYSRDYQVAVITDEMVFQSEVSWRDQIKHQYAHLSAVGWQIVPLWTVDVFIDPGAAIAQIKNAVSAVLAEDEAPAEETVATSAVADTPITQSIGPFADGTLVIAETPDQGDPSGDQDQPLIPVTDLPTQPMPIIAPPRADAPLLPASGLTDSDNAWGENPNRSREDEIKRDKPPHWS